MLKKLKELLRRDPEQFRIPRSVQEVIPIRTAWKSGIFLVGPNRYSRTWQFSDINYALAVRRIRNPCCWDTAAF